MNFILSGVDFEIDFKQIYNKLTLSEKAAFDTCKFLSKVSTTKDMLRRTKYIVGPPYNPEMEENSALMYIMLFGSERDRTNDKIQINNFAFKANLILSQFDPSQIEDFLSLLQYAEYSHAIKEIFKNNSADEIIIPDKCVNFYFDELQYDNVYKIALYKGSHDYKAQQWTEDEKGNIIKGNKERIPEDIFYSIMARAIDLMFEIEGKNYGQIAEMCLPKLKDYFSRSTEETLGSYELMNVIYEEAIEKNIIPLPHYYYNNENFIQINLFESHSYIREFLISKDKEEFLIGSQINSTIELDCEQKMVYELVDINTFKKNLMIDIVNCAHKSRLITSIKNIDMIIPTSQFDNFGNYIKINTFDFDKFYMEVLYEGCLKGMIAINPYTFYDNSLIIPNIDDKVFMFNRLHNSYFMSSRDNLGIINKTEILNEKGFTDKLIEAIKKESSRKVNPDKITISNMEKFRKPNNGFDIAKYIEYVSI